MILSRKEVERIASLARLELTEEEKRLYQKQLSAVLEYAERLKSVDIDGVAPTSSAVPLRNVLRDDEVEPSLSTGDALFNAPRKAQDQFKIQAVLRDEVTGTC